MRIYNKKKLSAKVQRRYLACLLTFFIAIGNPLALQTCYAEENLYALSAVLLDGDTGRVLYGKEENVPRANASTTKILTCILALEEANLDEIVQVSKLAASQPKVHAGIQENELYYIEDLLYSLMLESHNDSAVAIAEHISGSVETFSDLMNEKAKEIGCKTANFVTPNGLDGKNETRSHSISAKDLGLIMRYCTYLSPKAEEFLKITQTRSYSFQEVTGKRQIQCNNKNSFLDMFEGVLSGKTGFTGEAGYCYVVSAEQNEEKLIVVVLGSGWPNNKNYKWIDTRKLLTYGFENYSLQPISESMEELRITVVNGISEKGSLFDTPEITAQLSEEMKCKNILIKEDEQITMKFDYSGTIEAPVTKGQIIGNCSVVINNEAVLKDKLYASEDVKKKTFGNILKKTGKLIMDFVHSEERE